MGARRTTRIDLCISQVGGVTREVFENSIKIGVQSYASGLIADLGLDCDVAVNVRTVDDGAKELNLKMNRTDARQNLTIEVDPDRIFDRICFEIYRNRDLLIPDNAQGKADAPEGIRAERERTLTNLSTGSSIEEHEPSLRLCVNIKWWNDWTERQKEELDSAAFSALQKEFFAQTGVPCKAPELSFDSRLAAQEYQVTVNDARLPKVQGSEDSAGDMLHAVERAMLDDRVAWFTRQTFYRMVSPVMRQWPHLYKQVSDHPGLDVVYAVVRTLIQEGVRIVSIDKIFDIFTKVPRPHETDDRTYITFGPEAEVAINVDPNKPMSVDDWTRLIRSSLKREITKQHATIESMGKFSANLHMWIYLLDPDLERAVYGNVSADVEAEVVDAIAAAVGADPQLIVTAETIRRSIWRMIERRLPHVTVLSWQELSPDLNLGSISRISL